MKYEDILRRVSEISTLKSEVDKMEGVLNLAHKDWENVLGNNIMYQDFCKGEILFSDKKKKTHIQMQWMKGFDSSFPVLVVGSFYLNKEDDDGIANITCRECPPLEKIYKAMMKLSNGNVIAPHKFSIIPCRKAFCSECTSVEEKCRKKNINMKNHWCVKKNRIFNGECLKNTLEVNFKNDFGRSPFLAIASLRIKGRYFYGEGFNQSKLFGEVVDLILFEEQALYETKLNIDYPDSGESCSLRETTGGESLDEPAGTTECLDLKEEGGTTECLDLKEEGGTTECLDLEEVGGTTESLDLEEVGGTTESLDLKEPIDAIPRGIKRLLEEEKEEKFNWNITCKHFKQ